MANQNRMPPRALNMGVSNVRSSAASNRTVSSSVYDQKMSRSGFVKTMGVGMTGVGAMAVGFGGVATAAGRLMTTVIATGNPSVDVQKVQDAVDNYGIVILKNGPNGKSFEFGTGAVEISKPVVLKGDGSTVPHTEMVGGAPVTTAIPATTIHGGGHWYDGYEPRGAITVTEQVPFEISGLTFDSFNGFGLIVLATSGDCKISGNAFINPIFLEDNPGGFPYLTMLLIVDWYLESNWQDLDIYLNTPPTLNGNMLVEYNKFFQNPDFAPFFTDNATPGYSTVYIGSPKSPVEYRVRYNSFYNAVYSCNSIGVDDFFEMINYNQGSLYVEHNYVDAGEVPTWSTLHEMFWKYVKISDNHVRARFPILVDWIEKSDIMNNTCICNVAGVGQGITSGWNGWSANTTISGNTITGPFLASVFVVRLPEYASFADNAPAHVSGNTFYNVTGSLGAVYVAGNNNTITANNYTKSGLPGWKDPTNPAGCVLLDAGTSGNVVTEIGRWPAGTSICDQILDLTDDPATDKYDGANRIIGWNFMCYRLTDEQRQRLIALRDRLRAGNQELMQSMNGPEGRFGNRFGRFRR